MLTVLMATYNGGKTLPATLESFQDLEAPDGGWRLVVVDNASTDRTASIVRQFADTLPLRYLHEPRPGKNIALNRGIDEVEGDLVVLTDDDVLPSADWLVQWRRTADRHAAYALFAGSILPAWERPPPAWLTQAVPLGPAFAVLAPPQDGPCNPRLVFGPNMAVRTEVFRQGHRFDESVGPRGPRYGMIQETEFTVRISQAGHRSWHAAGAVVHHMVPARHMTESWILRRARHFGGGELNLAWRMRGRTRRSALALAAPLPGRLAMQAIRSGMRRWSRDRATRVGALWDWNVLVGSTREAWSILAGGASPPVDPPPSPVPANLTAGGRRE